MVVSARDLPAAKLRRWLWHGALGVAALLSIWGAITAASRRGTAARSLEQAVASLEEHRVSADALAAECRIAKFSDEKALEKFPMPIPAYATKQQSDCLRKVSVARADLIEDHGRIGAARKELDEARSSAGRRIWLAWILTAASALGLYVTEIHSRPRARRPAAAGMGVTKGRPT